MSKTRAVVPYQGRIDADLSGTNITLWQEHDLGEEHYVEIDAVNIPALIEHLRLLHAEALREPKAGEAVPS